VHSDADAAALHVRLADEAVAIGPPPARESYLRADKIVDAIKRTGADAVHPGYGFLSENAGFAEAVAAAGATFIGPPPAAIRAMRAARSVGYVGAGTIEMLFDAAARSFYFLEMNTRLQVEHPITELVTGVDLVRWQIAVAQGERIPLAQEAIPRRGATIECRIY